MLEAIRSMEALKEKDGVAYRRIEEVTSFYQDSRKKMSEVANGIAFPAMRANVCEQFQGFFQLKDIGEIERDAYGMPKDRRRVFDSGLQELKQPDVVMLHYLFPEDFSPQIQAESFKYYEKRCKHGSSLSPSVHCVVGLRNGFDEYAYAYLSLTALLDLKNMHMDKNLYEGIHIACAGGTWCATVYGFGGVHFRGNELIASLHCLFFREIQNANQITADLNVARSTGDFWQTIHRSLSLVAHTLGIASRALNQTRSTAFLIIHDGQQQVHRLDVLVVVSKRQGLSFTQGLLKFCRQFVLSHLKHIPYFRPRLHHPGINGYVGLFFPISRKEPSKRFPNFSLFVVFYLRTRLRRG